MSASSIVVTTPSFTTDDGFVRSQECIELFKNIATTITLNNKTVYRHAWTYTGTASNNITNHPHNATLANVAHVKNGTKLIYLKLANDFVDFNYGLVLSQVSNTGTGGQSMSNTSVAITPCAIEGYDVVDTLEKFTGSSVFTSNSNNGWGVWFSKQAGNNWPMINLYKVLSYSGTDIAFIAEYGLCRSAIFSYAKNIMDPTDLKPIFILCELPISKSSAIDTNDDATGAKLEPDSSNIEIYFNNSRFAYSVTSSINKFSSVANKCILYKFTYRGYYCDNIFTYEGEIPHEHFIYDEHEYVRMARNIVIKLS